MSLMNIVKLGASLAVIGGTFYYVHRRGQARKAAVEAQQAVNKISDLIAELMEVLKTTEQEMDEEDRTDVRAFAALTVAATPEGLTSAINILQTKIQRFKDQSKAA